MKFTTEEEKELREELLSALWSSAIPQRLEDFTDKEIGELLFYHVWCNIDMLSPQIGVIEQAFLRLGFDPDKTSQTED